MKPLRVLIVLLALVAINLSSCFVSADDSTYYSVTLGTVTAGTVGGTVGTLAALQSSGTSDTPSQYLLLTAGASGFGANFPVNIPSTTSPVTAVQVVINIKGDGGSWTWQFKNGASWTSIGSFTTTGTWTQKTLNVPKALAVASSAVRIVGPANKKLKLDYMRVLRKTCPVNPATYGGTCPFATFQVKASDYTYQLTQSTAALKFWTAPNTRRITNTAALPTNKISGLSISVAKNEYEGFQLIIAPTSTASAVVKINPVAGITFAFSKMGYVNGLADPLTPFTNGSSVTLSASANTGIYIKAYVASNAAAGIKTTTLTVGGVAIPVSIEVFNFALPTGATFQSQFNIGWSSVIPPGGTVAQGKSVLYNLRWSAPTTTWPSGFGYGITWDSAANPNRCSAFYDEPDEGADYSIKYLAKKYISGVGWNGVGFSLNHILQFVDNSNPRPATFCGQSLGSDPKGTTAYNNAWKAYLTALRNYLNTNGYLAKSYYYIQNEPQTAADLSLAAFLCNLTKTAAPGLKIAVSEEPKPGIYNDPNYPCGYNIWIAHVPAYNQTNAWPRVNLGEVVWFYTLDPDPAPYPNPVVASNQGVHQRVWTWASWRHRVRGYAYYNAGIWFANNRPTLRAEIWREGFEDYEYFFKANGNAHPMPNVVNKVDDVIYPVAQSIKAWSAEPALYLGAKKALGRRIANTALPWPRVKLVVPQTNINPIYINFQNTSGAPTANPLVVNGKTYKKHGWTAYNAAVGYGFTVIPSQAMYATASASGFNALQTSLIYDDYGQSFTFEAAVPAGSYKVTVSVGWPGKPYSDRANVVVEGVPVIVDFVSTAANSIKAVTATITCTDGRLTVVAGGNDAYTFLQYLEIVSA